MCLYVQSCNLVHMPGIHCHVRASSTGCAFVCCTHKVQCLYFKPGLSRSKRKGPCDVTGTAKMHQAVMIETKVKIIQWSYRRKNQLKNWRDSWRRKLAGGFPLFEEALIAFEAQDLRVEWYLKVAAAAQNAVQCSRVIYDERKRATTQTSLDHFFKRVDRVEYSRELEPGPSMSGVSEIAAYPPSPAADCPSLSSPPLPPPVRNSVHLMLDSVYQW